MLRLSLQIPALIYSDASAWKRVLPRFMEEAGTLIVSCVQSVIGFDSLYTLSEKYRVEKPKLKQYVHFSGRPEDQPLILSGDMIRSLGYHQEGDLLVIQLDEDKAFSEDGYDYGEEWEQRVHYLELGLQMAEPKLAELMAKIICEEMGFEM